MIGTLLLLATATLAPAPADPALQARVVDRACALVARHYWNKAAIAHGWTEACARARADAGAATDRHGLYTRLNALLDTLDDSHVFAVDPVRVALDRAHDRGRVSQGLGFAMAPDADGRWRVTQVRAGGPAARAGIVAGWEVRAIDGQPVDVDYQPPAGGSARVTLARADGSPIERVLAAEAEAPLPMRRAIPLDRGMLLVALDGFDPGDDRWLRDTLRDARPAALILDLRGNDGGDADVIARVAGSLFAANRPLVDRIGVHHSLQRTTGAGPGSFLGPLAVLIGPESASGAEALAALVDESGRGITVGQRTAGALTGAALYRLPDGGELSVAEFDIRTPGGRRLEGRGLAPRVPVTPTPAERRAGADPVLARARALLTAQRKN